MEADCVVVQQTQTLCQALKSSVLTVRLEMNTVLDLDIASSPFLTPNLKRWHLKERQGSWRYCYWTKIKWWAKRKLFEDLLSGVRKHTVIYHTLLKMLDSTEPCSLGNDENWKWEWENSRQQSRILQSQKWTANVSVQTSRSIGTSVTTPLQRRGWTSALSAISYILEFMCIVLDALTGVLQWIVIHELCTFGQIRSPD